MILSHGYTHTRLTALFPGLPGWAGTRKVKPIWILLKQETLSGSDISWAICKSAPSFRQITTPAPHHSVFLQASMPFLPPNQQRQSTEGRFCHMGIISDNWYFYKFGPLKIFSQSQQIKLETSNCRSCEMLASGWQATVNWAWLWSHDFFLHFWLLIISSNEWS